MTQTHSHIASGNYATFTNVAANVCDRFCTLNAVVISAFFVQPLSPAGPRPAIYFLAPTGAPLSYN